MKLFFTIVLLLIITASFGQSIALDGNFNAVGKAAMRTGGGICSAMAIQEDGKIILGGRGGENVYNSGFCLVRFNTNGTIDTTFGNKGMTITVYGGNIQSIIILPDGKILAGGFLGNVLLARYNIDGKLDSTFGNNGLVQPQFPGIRYSYCYALKLQQDGKIVMTGNVNGVSLLTARFLSDGEFDTSFAGVGYSILTSAYIGFDAAVQQDGKILVAGQGLNASNFLLLRYLPNGTLDTDFGDEGMVQTDMSDMSEFLSSIALQADGKIIAAGRYDYNNQYNTYFKTALIRYNVNGSLDSSFGTNAITRFQFDDASADPKKVMIQADGKIVIAGDYTDIYNFHKPALTKFTSNGTLDYNFGDGGSIVTSSFGDSLTCRSAAIQPDGKIVIGGYQMVKLDTSIIYYIDSFVVVRYGNNATLPVTFLNFSATKQQTSVLLNWQTANEVNNDHFSLERATGNGFSEIANISAGKNAYSYIDNEPANGANYYRIKQVDKDGKAIYSTTQSIVFNNNNKYVIFPNPVVNVINIKGLNANEKYAFRISDVRGHILAQTSTSNNSSIYTWHIENLSKGFYYLTIVSGNKTQTTVKFVKQ